MICINDGEDVSLQKRNLTFLYLKYGGYSSRTWHEPLIRERGQRLLSPTILVEWVG